MGMTVEQTNRVWQLMVEADVRSRYFGELAVRYNRRKQLITGASLFLASGAAATLAASLWVLPLIFSGFTALIMAYSVAVGLDRKVTTLTKLYASWHEIQR